MRSKSACGSGEEDIKPTERIPTNQTGIMQPLGKFVLLDDLQTVWQDESDEVRMDWREKAQAFLESNGNSDIASSAEKLETFAATEFRRMRITDAILEEVWHLAQDPSLPEGAMEVLVKYYKWKVLVEQNPGRYHYGQSASDEKCIQYCQQLEQRWGGFINTDGKRISGEEILLRLNFGTLGHILHSSMVELLVRDLASEANTLFAVDRLYGHLGNETSES